MSKNERYEHLGYIRDFLFYNVTSTRESYLGMHALAWNWNEVYAAQIFYNSLLTWKCIGSDNSTLLPISSFCDHTHKIFRVFSNYFQILPEILQLPDWISFFKKLNLKQNLM